MDNKRRKYSLQLEQHAWLIENPTQAIYFQAASF